MASVKYAISAYVADGTTTDYLITWDYLDEDHIAVYVDGTSNADPTASHTFVKLNNTTLRITDNIGNAIVAGSEIEIRRETPLTTRAITFADGSALLAADLNKNSDYLLYSMQEVLDTVDAAAQDGALAAQVATEALRDQAEIHKDDAETAMTTTQGYLATVQSDAADADNHRIAAAASEAASAASEAAAATSETNSANSATASANSATASAASAAASLASEQASAASETAAAASETAAAASEAASAASEAAAAVSEANAAASYDNFDDRYLGAKSTAPTVDNDGDALLVGALYWNDVSDAMYVWNGTAWDTLPTTIGIADGATSTQVTITDTLVSSAQNFQTANPANTTIGTTTIADAPVKLAVRADNGHFMAIDDNQIATTESIMYVDAYGANDGTETQVQIRARDASGAMQTTAIAYPDRLYAPVLSSNQFRGYGDVNYYHNDYDESSSGVNGHLFYSNNNTIPYGGFQSNDFYIQDNLSVGRVRLPDDSYYHNTDGNSTITLYSSNTTTGPADWLNYVQIISRNSTDPDYGAININSAYVRSQSADASDSDHMAHVIDNGGRIWSWSSHYAGATRRGDSGTTTNYHVADHAFTCYSNTGGIQGESSNNGYTQIVGRETANSDMVFRVSVAGSDRIHFYANGNGYFDGGADMGAADYAEYFEWSDGNPNNEDRRGYSVVLENGKIRIATSEDNVNDLIGIVSVHAAICGDAAHMAWQGRYKLDKFGARVTQDVNHTCWMDKPDGDRHESLQWDNKYSAEYIAENNIEVPDHAQVITTQVPVESDEYDPQTEYIPRADRPEWSPIGLMGKLPLLKGEPVHPRWIKLYEMNDEVDMWLVR